MTNTGRMIEVIRHNSRVATKVSPKEGEMVVRTGFVVAIVFLGLLVMAQEISTDYDHNYDFSQLHTFSVKIGTSWGNQLSEERAKEAVSKVLVQKGWQSADEASADALVVIHGATESKKTLDTFYSGGWGGYGWGGFGAPGTATTSVNEYRVGTMVVDVFDAKSKKLVFRGAGQDEISDKPEKNIKKIEKGAEKIFKKFPPQPKEQK
ncbi:MAG TPA: DUF4136 domain-containing protein [Verrucomicrobiae bacterium]|jgi:hypothetical protein|nr:DUF4136 domain-containing protein [Verrucomicrobiae bacterium]